MLRSWRNRLRLDADMLRRTAQKELEGVARRAALRAAAIQKKYYERRFRVMLKGVVNLLTDADLESQKAIVATIKKAFPQHDVLAEEEKLGHTQSLDGPIWVIDPLDGTTNFAHGFPMFGISIAFRDSGRTQFGLVYQPLLKEMFVAHRGKGTTLNGRRLRVSRTKKFDQSLLATGFPYDRRTSPENNLDLFSHFEMTSQCVRRAGAATLDLANLAAGRFDGFWEPKLAPWDVAAGILLVEEAGGRVTTYSGAPLTDLWCGEIVASNGRIHNQMIESIRRVRKKRGLELST
jgi:myo-inositol-1(or 4)-monophosphatase